MNRKIFIMLSLVVFTLAAKAQTGNGNNEAVSQKAMPEFCKNIVLELSVGTGTKHDDIQQLELGAVLGYRFIPRMYAFMRGGTLYGLGDESEDRHYVKSQTLGGGLGFNVCRFDNTDIDLRFSMGSSIGNADWKHTVYDAAVVARVGRIGSIKMNVGLGYRHISSRTEGFGAHNNFFCTLGFGF